MDEIAKTLQGAGYDTFLPQEDGLEGVELLPRLIDRGLDRDRAGTVVSQAIFSFDVYQLLSICSATVANLNGRVPDEGTVVEAALTWMSNHPLLLYKDDGRVGFAFGDNPMLTGLGDHKVIHNIHQLPLELASLTASPAELLLPRHVERIVEAGKRIAEIHDQGDLVMFLLDMGSSGE